MEYLQMIDQIAASDDFVTNARLTSVLINAVRNNSIRFDTATADKFRRFLVSELKRVKDTIPTLHGYEEKDKLFYYEDSLVGLFTFTVNNVKFSDEDFTLMTEVCKAVDAEQCVENAVRKMLKLDSITEKDALELTKLLADVKDEYERGIFYKALVDGNDDGGLKKFTPEAKLVIADYIGKEIERYLSLKTLDRTVVECLEFAADVCGKFASDKLLDKVETLLRLKLNNIRYYALRTLLENGRNVPTETVAEMAQDLEYAELTHSLLERNGKAHLFPTEYSSPEYLAKSDMVHWLCYPTELGKAPDAIEPLGEVTVKKSRYFVFKYRSDSDNLSDDLINEWLIGWSSDDGGTFSNFDLLSDFEKKTPEKTLKHIKKKLLG